MSRQPLLPDPQGPQRLTLAGNIEDLNRGCEALALGTSAAFRAAGQRSPLPYFYNRRTPCPPNREHPLLSQTAFVTPMKWEPGWVLNKGLGLLGQGLLRRRLFGAMEGTLKPGATVLSMGGDSFSLDYGFPSWYLALNEYLLEKGAQVYLWGSSVGPFTGHPREGEVIDNLDRCTKGVFAREERTVRYLRQAGYRGRILRMADPAFLMAPEKPSREELGFELPPGALGVNLSPKLGKYLGLPAEQWTDRCRAMLTALCRAYAGPVVLIPHVMLPWNNDHPLLERLSREVKPGKGGLFLCPPTLTSPQVKWVISRTKALLAARTHAAIAGLSSSVPTITVSFSIKALGINEGLFGHSRYTLDHRKMDEASVVGSLRLILKDAGTIRRRLRSMVPKARSSVVAAARTALALAKEGV